MVYRCCRYKLLRERQLLLRALLQLVGLFHTLCV